MKNNKKNGICKWCAVPAKHWLAFFCSKEHEKKYRMFKYDVELTKEREKIKPAKSPAELKKFAMVKDALIGHPINF